VPVAKIKVPITYNANNRFAISPLNICCFFMIKKKQIKVIGQTEIINIFFPITYFKKLSMLIPFAIPPITFSKNDG
jgi:hypothetical protein